MFPPKNNPKEDDNTDQENRYIPGTKIISNLNKKKVDHVQQRLDVLIHSAKEAGAECFRHSEMSISDDDLKSHHEFPVFLKKYKQTPVQKIRTTSLGKNRKPCCDKARHSVCENVNFPEFTNPSLCHIQYAKQNKDTITWDKGSIKGSDDDEDEIQSTDDIKCKIPEIIENFDKKFNHLRELYIKQRNYYISTYKYNNDLVSEAFNTIKQLRDELIACNNRLNGKQSGDEREDDQEKDKEGYRNNLENKDDKDKPELIQKDDNKI